MARDIVWRVWASLERERKRRAAVSGTLPPPPPALRTESTDEMTAVVPRDSLPPVSVIPGPTIEQIADIERARRDAEDQIETLVPCIGPCRTCSCCHGEHMISSDRLEEWRRTNPQGG